LNEFETSKSPIWFEMFLIDGSKLTLKETMQKLWNDNELPSGNKFVPTILEISVKKYILSYFEKLI
jgi:hypothetical protein